MTLGWRLTHTAQDELFAAIEGTAFHKRIILERMAEHGVPVSRVINGGGIPQKNEVLNRVYASVFGKPVLVPSSEVTSLGSAIFAFLAAGTFQTVEQAQAALCPKFRVVEPDAKSSAVLPRTARRLPQALFFLRRRRRTENVTARCRRSALKYGSRRSPMSRIVILLVCLLTAATGLFAQAAPPLLARDPAPQPDPDCLCLCRRSVDRRPLRRRGQAAYRRRRRRVRAELLPGRQVGGLHGPVRRQHGCFRRRCKGGVPRRLTWHPDDDLAVGWTRTGRRSSSRLPATATPASSSSIWFLSMVVSGGAPPAHRL